MGFVVEAACGCNKGKIRKNNEDNFYFGGKCLEVENDGLKKPAYIDTPVKRGLCYAVFDGIGGENYGEIASFAAAQQMQLAKRTLRDFFVSDKEYLNRLSLSLNEAVLQAKRDLCTDRMGTTMVSLYFSGRNVYVCNIGDSRAYRLRDGEFLQLSEDHIERYPGRARRKAPLTQHLGIDPEDMLIEPYITKSQIQKGDVFLLCSDGLTDMLDDFEISRLIQNSDNAIICVEQLIQEALNKGGRDNITVIVCRISR